jgi:hypothetical protein
VVAEPLTLRAAHSETRGQSSRVTTIIQTMPHAIQVMVGCAACHSKNFL